eukprot:gnl/MRDRNA2_/MRDRNA2_233129_c0_seq1.p1 gnl/MRDRNA2_/MRDRNA2_233129_c0~~gnl/MRDRNA2_/MRDRNA2_233129_c0_seq1.p1  ORF type:complete len:517 (-),score=86.30 gnl/MRDRNA2_/MRDRNA2_233129_c0_seq1:19-1539(-)
MIAGDLDSITEVRGVSLALDFFARLPADEIDNLYNECAAVLLVFRHMPPLAQQFVMRFLFMRRSASFKEGSLRSCTADEATAELEEALTFLRKFRVFVPGTAPLTIMINPIFHKRLLAHLSGEQLSSARPSSGSCPSAKELEHYAIKKWQQILEYTVNGTVGVLDQSMVTAISDLGLRKAGHVTAKGFRVVLEERQQQLWLFVLHALQQAKERRQHLPLVKAIMDFSEARIGDLVCIEEGFQKFLANVGVVCKSNEGCHATIAAVSLFMQDASSFLSRTTGRSESDLPCHMYSPVLHTQLGRYGGTTISEEQGIIVESNFKVYAFFPCDSIHARLLEMFCLIHVRLPNLVVGQITAEVTMQAISNGIKAEQLIRYLEGAAHPRALLRTASAAQPVAKRLRGAKSVSNSPVPANVRVQLMLWESNRNRVQFAHSVTFDWEVNDCNQAGLKTFGRAVELAKSEGFWLWSFDGVDANDPSKALQGRPILVVKAEGADRLRKFLEDHGLR